MVNGFKGQNGFNSGYHIGMRVVMLIKIILFSLFAVLSQFSFLHNSCASG